MLNPKKSPFYLERETFLSIVGVITYDLFTSKTN